MSPVRMALAVAAALYLLHTGYARTVVDQSSSASQVSGAVHASVFRQHVVSRQEAPKCILSQEYLDCVRSCQVTKAKCVEGPNGKCSKAIVPCTAPDCCFVSEFSQSSLTAATYCSKSCCYSVDGSGKQLPATSCKGSTSTGSSGAAAPAASSTSSKCFPAHATVELESGARLRMDDLRVGDRVRVDKRTFSDVFLFTHKLDRETADFVVIQTASHHKVSMTPGHYVYVNGTSLVPAASVQVGDELTLESGARSAVISVSETVYTGVYNPQTLHGDVVVDGIVASTYTTSVSPILGHAPLSPLRALYSALGVTTELLNGGANFAARLLPSGLHS